MSLVVDANVFVAAAREEEPHWSVSIDFLTRIRFSGQAVYCPAIVLPECSAAIARRTGSADLALEVLRRGEARPSLLRVHLTTTLARRAAELAGGEGVAVKDRPPDHDADAKRGSLHAVRADVDVSEFAE